MPKREIEIYIFGHFLLVLIDMDALLWINRWLKFTYFFIIKNVDISTSHVDNFLTFKSNINYIKKIEGNIILV